MNFIYTFGFPTCHLIVDSHSHQYCFKFTFKVDSWHWKWHSQMFFHWEMMRAVVWVEWLNPGVSKWAADIVLALISWLKFYFCKQCHHVAMLQWCLSLRWSKFNEEWVFLQMQILNGLTHLLFSSTSNSFTFSHLLFPHFLCAWSPLHISYSFVSLVVAGGD